MFSERIYFTIALLLLFIVFYLISTLIINAIEPESFTNTGFMLIVNGLWLLFYIALGFLCVKRSSYLKLKIQLFIVLLLFLSFLTTTKMAILVKVSMGLDYSKFIFIPSIIINLVLVSILIHLVFKKANE